MNRQYYLYVLNRNTMEAVYICANDGTLTDSAYGILKPGLFFRVMTMLVTVGDRINVPTGYHGYYTVVMEFSE